jgi:protein O-GlcNAc transferase
MNTAVQQERHRSPLEEIKHLHDEFVQQRKKKQPVSIELLVELTRLSLNAGRPHDALAYLDDGLKLQPRQFDLLNMRGIALRRLGKYDEAILVLEQATKVNPKHAGPYINKANILLELKRSAEAAEFIGSLVRLNPKHHEFQRLLGNAYIQLGDLPKAVSRFETAIRLMPNDLASWIDRIKAATDYEHHDEAFELVERALKHLPGNHRLIEARIMVLRRGGRFKEAENLLLARISEAPDDAWAHFQYAETVGRFDREKGNKHYKRAVELEPDNAIYWMNYANSLDRSRYGNEAEHIQAGYEAVIKALGLGPLPSRFVRMARNILVRMGRFDLVAPMES